MTWRCREAGDGEEAQAAMASHRQDIFTADRGSQQSEAVYIFRVPSTGEKNQREQCTAAEPDPAADFSASQVEPTAHKTSRGPYL